jgi:hypothetical protein
MTKPENSLHFRRQKIQAEVFWAVSEGFASKVGEADE